MLEKDKAIKVSFVSCETIEKQISKLARQYKQTKSFVYRQLLKKGLETYEMTKE